MLGFVTLNQQCRTNLLYFIVLYENFCKIIEKLNRVKGRTFMVYLPPNNRLHPICMPFLAGPKFLHLILTTV